MGLGNYELKDDLDFICYRSNIDFTRFEGKTILITGATGMIGYTLISSFIYYGEKSVNPPKIVALVRNIEKAKNMYCFVDTRNVDFIVTDVTETFNVDGTIDFIIHGASQTSSKAFVSEPVETIRTSLVGTENILKLANEKRVKSIVYLSSMEVYGAPNQDGKISENYPSNLDLMSVRSSYPESKRMCESLCSAYCHEYGVPAKVLRLTQTFGPGVMYDDGRVFAEFARCHIEKKNIVLHTNGRTKRNYLYTADAITAILTVLLDGENSCAYNAANENTYCSIYEMAELVANLDDDNSISVEIVESDSEQYGYAPELYMNLSTTRLRWLGWKASIDLPEMYQRLCVSMLNGI